MNSAYECLDTRLRALELQVGIATQNTDPKRETFIARIRSVHAKIDSIYAQNQELQHMPAVMKQFHRPGRKHHDVMEAAIQNLNKKLETQAQNLDEKPDRQAQNQEQESVKEVTDSSAVQVQGVPENTATAGPLSKISDYTMKEELVLVKLKQMVSFYNNLKEVSIMTLPELEPDVLKKLDPDFLLTRRNRINALIREFDLVLAKQLLVLEKYSSQVNMQAKFSKSVQGRLREATIAVNSATIATRQNTFH